MRFFAPDIKGAWPQGQVFSHSEPGRAVWRELAQKIERDESVCRKFVWLPPSDAEDREVSLARFIQRTPLASPWRGLMDVHEQNLDATDYLVRNLALEFQEECSLPSTVLQRWLQVLEHDDGTGAQILSELVAAITKETNHD